MRAVIVPDTDVDGQGHAPLQRLLHRIIQRRHQLCGPGKPLCFRDPQFYNQQFTFRSHAPAFRSAPPSISGGNLSHCCPVPGSVPARHQPPPFSRLRTGQRLVYLLLCVHGTDAYLSGGLPGMVWSQSRYIRVVPSGFRKSGLA